MKMTKYDNSDEKQILIGMIVNDVVCGHISSIWEKEGLFESKWSNLVASWCVKYQNKYSKAPQQDIEKIFMSWAADSDDTDTADMVDQFLQSLSDEYEETNFNHNYILDRASIYFNGVKLKRLSETIEGDLDLGNVEAALKRLNNFGHVEVGSTAGIDVLRDTEAIQTAFEEKKEPLIRYPNDLGKFFDESLERDGFIAFMGPEKRGKTFWLLDVAWRGMLQRRKVAFFAVGDMSQAQMLRRIHTRAAKTPIRPGVVKIPRNIIRDEEEDGQCFVEFEEREFKKGLTWRQGLEAAKKTIKRTRSKETLFRLSCHPNSTLSVLNMQSILKTWEREGWVPDVVVIDYADILANPPGYKESRDAINASWKQMRAMSQSLHCLVVTATQADAASYTANTLSTSNFSEDKRKYAHVTGMVGLNQNIAEKAEGIMRLNWLVLRENEFSSAKTVTVATCFPLANPAVKSIF